MSCFKGCGWLCWWRGQLASAAVSIIAVFTFSLIKGGFFGKLQGARTARCDIHWCVCWQLAVLLHCEYLSLILKFNCTCDWTEHFCHVKITSFMFVCTSKGQTFVPKLKYFCKCNHQCFCACTNVFIPASVFTRHFAPSCGSHWYYTNVQPSFSSASADISLTKDTNVLDKVLLLGVFFIFCSLIVVF